MFGFACTDTPELMPLPIHLAHRLAEQLTVVRKSGQMPYLRPDGKTQVTIGYEGTRAVCLDTIVVSTQHAEDVDLDAQLAPEIRKLVVEPGAGGRRPGHLGRPAAGQPDRPVRASAVRWATPA